MATDVLARLSVLIDAQTKQFGVALNGLNTQLNKFGATVNAQATSISNFEKRIAGIQRTLGSVGLAFGAFQIANVIQDSVRRIAEFEQQVATVGAIAGATGDELNRLREDALRLGSASKFTATEVAQLQTEFARLGFTTDEILAATEATIQLATATGEDLAKSADVAGSTVRAFGLSASETQRVVDVMAESFNRSALGLDNFAESMKFVAPIAASANISIEETTALLGVLADAGIRGSNAGTALRRIITDLAKDGRPLADRLKELSDRGLDFGGAMDEVGRFAQSALLVLTKNVDKVNDATEAYKNAEGAAAATAELMRDTLTGDIEKLTSAWDGFILSLDKGDGSLRETVQALTQIVEAITRISNSGFGEFVADWFRLTQVVPRFAIGVIDMFATWGDEVEVTREQAGKLFYELNRLKSIAELEGKTEEAERYGKALDEITAKFGDMGKEVGFVGPQLQQITDPRILAGLNNAGGETLGIIANLEEKAKALGEAIKNATSIQEIRELQRELDGVKIKIDSIINPSTPPKPIKIPIEFAPPESLDVTTDAGRGLFDAIQRIIPEKGFVIPVAVEFLESADEDFQERMQKLKETVEQTSIDISSLLAGATTSIAEALGNATATGFENFGQDILKIVAGFAKQFGELLIASGFAALSLKVLIKNPFTAIAAGAALVALASSVQATANRAAKTAFSGGAATGSDRATTQFARERAGEQIVFAQGEFKVRGTDLVLVLDQTARKMQRTG